MYKINLFYLFLICLVFALPGCRNQKENNKEGNNTFKMVEVPAIITDQNETLAYIAGNFWENMDFTKQSVLKDKDNLDFNFYNFLQFVRQVPRQTAENSFRNFTEKLLRGDSLVIDHFRELTEKSLNHPNSPYRNEDLYIPFLESLILSPKTDTTVKQNLVYQLNLANRNRPGKRAEDFKFCNRSDRELSLYGIGSEYLLLVFIDPDCPACQITIEQMKRSETIRKYGKRVKILTLYTGPEYKQWVQWSEILDNSWINGYDREMAIHKGPLYDLRPTPSLYLLDRDKVVIFKDAPLQTIEEYLAKC
ncbi:MAG: DUF5106 domain-containing protein [Bacteroidales bacterium]|nr:DUF5106 domain-containing protein [Bacteroidales bacterium]MDD2425496.1 DUF5106 domain-containing protein [Bacteroidales bacterium]MDD3989780.1 DUF5106 domain-containing protein [Bacteroidales bacterium]